MIRIIDSHQHFWQLSRGDYSWLTPDFKPLYHDFLPNNLQPILKELHIAGTILVQAAPTLAETRFLLDLAEKTDFVLGVVGWIDMEAAHAVDLLTQLTQESRYFRGIRPMLQDISDTNWMLNANLTSVFHALTQLNLTFDALISPEHLKNLNILCERHPKLKIVIDHAAKPNIKNKALEPWASDLAQVSQHKNVYCKLSGLLTEAKPPWNFIDLKPYFDHIFYCFGVKRILWGSDWPVLTITANYRQWFELCHAYVAKYFPTALSDIFSGNASLIYQL